MRSRSERPSTIWIASGWIGSPRTSVRSPRTRSIAWRRSPRAASRLYGPADIARRSGVISFNFADIHAHDLASILDIEGVCVRAGHHCTMPLMDKMGWPATARASFYLYTTERDVDQLADSLEKAAHVFKVA